PQQVGRVHVLGQLQQGLADRLGAGGDGDAQVTVAQAGVQGAQLLGVGGQLGQGVDEQGTQGAGAAGPPHPRPAGGVRPFHGNGGGGDGRDRCDLPLGEERGGGRRVQQFGQFVVEQQQRQGRPRHLQAGGELADVA